MPVPYIFDASGGDYLMKQLKSRREILGIFGLSSLSLILGLPSQAFGQSHSGKSGYPGKGKSGGGHSDEHHTDGDHEDTDAEHDHETQDHESGKRGPQYRGGRGTTRISQGSSLEERVFRADTDLLSF